MSVISKIKQIAKLRRKAYRDAYVEQHVKTSLPFQIRAMREEPERDWSQADLGEKAGMRQNAISRLEKADYGNLSVNTLLRLASAFDVALLIKFVPFGKLIEEFKDLSAEALQVPSFDNEVASLEQAARAETAVPIILMENTTFSFVHNHAFQTQPGLVTSTLARPEVEHESGFTGFPSLTPSSTRADLVESAHIH